MKTRELPACYHLHADDEKTNEIINIYKKIQSALVKFRIWHFKKTRPIINMTAEAVKRDL